MMCFYGMHQSQSWRLPYISSKMYIVPMPLSILSDIALRLIGQDLLTLQRDPSRSSSLFLFPHTFPPASPCTSRHPRVIRQRTRRNDSATDTCLLPLAVFSLTAAPRPKDIPTHSSYNDSRSSYSDIGCVLGIKRWYSCKKPDHRSPCTSAGGIPCLPPR